MTPFPHPPNPPPSATRSFLAEGARGGAIFLALGLCADAAAPAPWPSRFFTPLREKCRGNIGGRGPRPLVAITLLSLEDVRFEYRVCWGKGRRGGGGVDPAPPLHALPAVPRQASH
ncbi:hypothetical protein EON64_08435 [archaeon]|nr:MAG: hypothetical protein EON64_08435 [archaeon]